MSSPSFNSSLEDFLAKVSALQETDEDFLMKHEGHSFLISQGFSPHDGLGTWYWRMLKVYLTTTREGRLKLFSEFSPTLGMTFSGKFSIVGTSEFHKIGNESILSDILEPRSEVDPKYFLSQKQVDGLKLFEGTRIPEATAAGSTLAEVGDSINMTYPNSETRRGRVGKKVAQTLDTSVQYTVVETDEPVESNEPRAFFSPKTKHIHQSGPRMRSEGDPSFTLTGFDQHDVALPVDYTISDMDLIGITEADENGTSFYIRRLTPTECERLQSFPDGWTEGVSNTQRYKQMGNAVTVNVVETVMRRLFGKEVAYED
jgi:site-specific DNA-cytosine methylase